ncbi:LysR substrate-binding domain-containing protein [Pelagibacterium sp.]|uniref:LysR substrate-binding domain-containing protein n=1 Tax=Pelagibacterium sp. TaxID=1967288 RepID=UPI003BA93760
MFSLDPDFLRTFLAISETGSFGAAGEKVNKTQSTVSAQMKRLEEIVGVPLFEREGRRNVLTLDGLKLLEYAASMVRLNDEALRAFQPVEMSGNLRLGAIDEYAQAFMPGTLRTFGAAHPAVQVEVITGSTAQLRDMLAEGELDAAIISCRAGDSEMEMLRADRLHWIGGEGTSAHFADPLPFCAWSVGCSWREMASAALARDGRDWRLAVATSNAALIGLTVRDGLGVAVAPSWFVSPGLRILEEMDARYPLGIAEIGIKRSTSAANPMLDAFIAHVKSELSSPALAA